MIKKVCLFSCFRFTFEKFNKKNSFMKKIFLLLTVFTFLFSCRDESGDISQDLVSLDKNISNENISSRRMQEIEKSDWIDFGNEYLNAYAKLYNYQSRKLESKEISESFYKEIGNANTSEEDVEKIYEKYGMDFEQVITYKNEMDNAVYSFAQRNPSILEVETQEEFQNDLLTGLEGVVGDLTPETPIYTTNGTVTADEIWDCAKEAVGLGFVSYLGIKTLRAVGAQIITKAITKTLVKFAGPLGTAIMVADFSFCIYGASQD